MSAGIHYYEMCVVCFEADPSYLFKPCRHRCVCKDCAHKYADGERFTTCPVCRKDFDGIEFDESEPLEPAHDPPNRGRGFEDEEAELAMALKLSLQESESAEEIQIAEMLELDRATRISIAEFQEAQHLEHKRLLYEIVEQVKEEARIVEKEIRSALPNNLSEAEHAAEETQLLMIKKLEDLCSKKKSEIQTIRESRKNQGKTNQASDASHNPFELPTRMTATGTFSDLPATNSCMLSSFSISNPTSVPSWSPTLIFNEIISATFRKHANPDYKLTIHGYMSLYFPTNTVVDLDSIKMGSFVFRLRNLDKVSFCADNHSSAFIPHSMTFDDISKQSEGIDNTIFTIEGRDILSALRKMVRRNQRAPYHRVTIFSYEIKDSQTGEVSLDFCPLTLYTEWVQGVFGTTKLSVKYKCNPSILKLDSIIYLRDVQITVEIDGHYTMLRSEPQARKSIDSNGICWTFPTLLGNSFGELTASFHTLSASQYGKVKATFNCEGSTLSGIEFELHDKNICPIRTTKRRFKSGNYICDSKTES